MRSFTVLLALLSSLGVKAQETISFSSLDGLELTADLYLISEAPDTPFIVLFHQAGSSRGEYLEIAPRLTDLGYNVLALDQRSGRQTNGVENETANRAGEAGLGTSYLDASADLEAALAYVRETYISETVIGWGSSYSASLALRLAGTSDLMDGVLAFSPGEYFAAQGNTFIQDAASGIDIPSFITSSTSEQGDWQAMFESIPSADKVGFTPAEGVGRHGSSTLFTSVPNSELYWQALTDFLTTYFPTDSR